MSSRARTDSWDRGMSLPDAGVEGGRKRFIPSGWRRWVDRIPTPFVALASGSAIVMGARYAGAAIGFLTQVVIARAMGADGLAIFYFAVALATILSIVATLGYPLMIPRAVSSLEEGRDRHALEEVLRSARREIGAVSAVFCILAVGLILLLPAAEEVRSALIFGALALPAFSLMRLAGAIGNAKRRFAAAYLPDLFMRPVLLLGAILLILEFAPLTLSRLMGVHLVLVIALAALHMWWVGGFGGPADASRMRARSRERAKAVLETWRRRAPPMVLAILFLNVFADLDLVVLAWLMPASELGVFGAALKVAMLFAFVIQALHQLILRDAADALDAEDPSRIVDVIRRANLAAVGLSLAAFLLVVAAGRMLLGIFGGEFVAAHPALLVMMSAQVVRAGAGPGVQLLALASQERAAPPVFVAGLGVLVVANVALAPTYGAMGAAIAVLMSTVVWTFGIALAVRSRMGIDPTMMGRRSPAR